MENCSSNILFSSVKGAPSFVHSPHIPSAIKSTSCSSYLSILDPNIELPELSTTEIDELLSESSSSGVVSASRVSTEECRMIPGIDFQSDLMGGFSSPLEGILFKCIVKSCPKNYPNKNAQMEHFYRDHREKVITCAICKSIFKSKYSLNNHFLVSPACKIKNSYRCIKANCDKYFFSQHNLETHLSRHHNIPAISCLAAACPDKFIDLKSRNDHVKAEHSEMTYLCEKCNRIFLDLHAFEKHNLKLHQETPSRLSRVFVCAVEGCGRCCGDLQELRAHTAGHGTPGLAGDAGAAGPGGIAPTVATAIGSPIVEPGPGAGRRQTEQPMLASIAADVRAPVKEINDIQIIYACPLPECSQSMVDKVSFQSHFLKHFTGELPGDINSLLPPDPPVPGLELHSKTFEAIVDSLYQREETNLVQALDLVPDKLWESLDLLNDEYDSLSPNCGLTSALILPSTASGSNRNLLKTQSTTNNRRRKNHYQNDRNLMDCTDPDRNNSNILGKYSSDDMDKNQDYISKYKCTETVNTALSYSLLSSAGSCARTCPKINSAMVNLIKRRRVFLKERVGMMESCDSVLYQPEARQPALKQVVRQIFNSQQLPNKYEEIVNVDSADL